MLGTARGLYHLPLAERALLARQKQRNMAIGAGICSSLCVILSALLLIDAPSFDGALLAAFFYAGPLGILAIILYVRWNRAREYADLLAEEVEEQQSLLSSSAVSDRSLRRERKRSYRGITSV